MKLTNRALRIFSLAFLLSVLLLLSGCAEKRLPPSGDGGAASAEEETAEDYEEDALPEDETVDKQEEEAAPPEIEIETTPEPVPQSTPTPFPMFDIVDGRTIMLSITEEEFIEYADFLRSELNINDAALAGILANLQCESGFNPNKVGDNGYAYGLCQWRGARLDQMVSYCREHQLNPVTKEGQLHFLVHDLKENYIYAYDQVRLCRDSEEGALQATYFFCAYYEVPADPDKESLERQELTELLIYPRLNELSQPD